MKKNLLPFSILFLFSVCSLAVFGQTAGNQTVTTENGVEDIYLAKDDGNGNAGDVTKTFATTDIPIHCVVMLNSMTAATVKMNFIAVSVKGVKPGLKVISISYKTDGKQNQVNFTGQPDKFWTAGNYRVDIFLDGKPAGNRAFEIQKPAGETEKTTLPAVKRFTSPKPARTPRVARRVAGN